MEFQWDEEKRQKNIFKHGIDFVDARNIFDGRPIHERPGNSEIEERTLTVAELHDELVAVVWTWRGKQIRIISARSARDAEKRAYRQLHVGRTE